MGKGEGKEGREGGRREGCREERKWRGRREGKGEGGKGVERRGVVMFTQLQLQGTNDLFDMHRCFIYKMEKLN